MITWWLIWIIAPKSSWSQVLANTWWPIAGPVVAYTILLIPELDSVGPILIRPQLTPIKNLLGTKPGAFAGWVHFLVMDFLVGQIILKQSLSQARSPWLIRLFLGLTLMVGPLGGLVSLIVLNSTREPKPLIIKAGKEGIL